MFCLVSDYVIVFASFLNRMRLGELTRKDEMEFNKQQRSFMLPGDLEATELFPTRYEVDRSNTRRMAALTGPEVTYTALEGGTAIPEIRDRLLASCLAAKTVVLKKDAQVMLLKNMDETLVNGTLGRVIAFMGEREYLGKVLDDERLNHASDDSDIELEIKELRDRKLENTKIQTSSSSNEMKWPLVRFTALSGETRDVLIKRESWKIELPNGEIQASRDQIPLILAWALSIHKAQGQTLERVKVDLGRVFEKGQAYVALSRATCREGLEVKNFSVDKVRVHERVTEFYRNLERLESSQHGSGENESDEEAEVMRAAAMNY